MLRASKIAALLSLPILCAVVLFGQQPVPTKPLPDPQRSGVPTFSSVTQLVVLPATVLDKNKGFVRGLTKDNFKVFDNGIEQTIKDCKSEDVPVSVGIIVDNSGSMREKRAKVNAAALVFVKTSNPQDEVFIVNFNEESFLDKDFTSDLDELREGLEKIDSRGGTAFYDALVMSLDHVHDIGKKPKKVLLVVTDGVDNASRFTLEQAVRAAHESETVIYTVGLLTDESRRDIKRAKKALEAISDASGGAAFFPSDLNEVESIATKIARDIRNQYMISYTPSGETPDGSFRTVRVTAQSKGQDKLMVRTRSGYYAGGKAPSSQ